MPIYEYEHVRKPSKICSKVFEVFQSMSEEPVKVCPVCDGPVRRIISRFSGHSNKLTGASLKDKGFTKLVKRDKGVYEAEK